MSEGDGGGEKHNIASGLLKGGRCAEATEIGPGDRHGGRPPTGAGDIPTRQRRETCFDEQNHAFSPFPRPLSSQSPSSHSALPGETLLNPAKRPATPDAWGLSAPTSLFWLVSLPGLGCAFWQKGRRPGAMETAALGDRRAHPRPTTHANIPPGRLSPRRRATASPATVARVSSSPTDVGRDGV